MRVRSTTAALVAASIVGVAACAAVTPVSPSARETPSGGTDATPAPATPSVSAALGSPAANPLDLDVGSLDPAWTELMLEFASDGGSIIYSSGIADGTAATAAPDLWRYTPGRAEPELVWQNPRRDRSLVRIAGDGSAWAFVEMPLDGSRAWDLWLVTDPGGEAIHLDSHPGDDDVPALVPSIVVHEDQVAWTAFDRGRDGPVSQLLHASAPAWEARVIAERPAREAELWFPSMRDALLAYTEVVYSADRLTDERHVYLADVDDPSAPPIRLDTSGRATMPLLVDDGVVWKEADRGFSMFNWGRLYFHDLRAGETSALSMAPQDYVNHPSAGLRFVAGWGADAFTFTVHDLDRGESRVVAQYDPATRQSVFRPHIAGSLLVWLYTTVSDSPPGDVAVPEVTEIRYAFVPGAGEDRLDGE